MKFELNSFEGVHTFAVTENSELSDTIKHTITELKKSLKAKDLEIEPSFQYLEARITESILADYFEDTIILNDIPLRIIGIKKERKSDEQKLAQVEIKAMHVNGSDTFSSQSFSTEQSLGAVKAAIRKSKNIPLDEKILLFRKEGECLMELDSKLLIKDVNLEQPILWRTDKRTC